VARSVPDTAALRLTTLKARLERSIPQLASRQQNLNMLFQRLEKGLDHALVLRRQRLAAAQQTLQALSPRLIINRGYAIVRDSEGKVVKNALDLKIGERLDVELSRGHVSVDVVRTHDLL
jgi:exodeoxyribonuclease VII large subunit